MLYKASDHDFNIQKYFELCGSAINTMILCETDKGKIIGGYTPNCHYSGANQWVPDYSNSSFLFSISNNDKIKLAHNSYAICQNTYKNSIQFGNN